MRKATKECPICGNSVLRGVNVCTSCGYDFDSFDIKESDFSPSLFFVGILTLAANLILPVFAELINASYLEHPGESWAGKLPFNPVFLLFIIGTLTLLWAVGWLMLMRGRDFSSFARTVASLAMSAIFLFAVIILYTAVFYASVSSGFFATSFTEAITFVIPSILIGLADLYIIAFLAALVHQKRSVFLLVLSVLGIIMLAPCGVICMTVAFTKTVGAIYIFLIPIAFTLTSAAFITASFISNHSHWQWL